MTPPPHFAGRRPHGPSHRRRQVVLRGVGVCVLLLGMALLAHVLDLSPMLLFSEHNGGGTITNKDRGVRGGGDKNKQRPPSPTQKGVRRVDGDPLVGLEASKEEEHHLHQSPPASLFLQQESDQQPAAFTTVTLDMTDAFAEAWATSSKRLTFATSVEILQEDGEEVEGEEDKNVNKKNAATVIPKKGDRRSGTATFYGKSSLKLKYTARRSIEVKLAEPVLMRSRASSRSSSSRTTDNDRSSSSSSVQLSHFVLLSLWEDSHRLAYLSSTALLRRLGLFHSHARLVELRCRAPTSTHANDGDGPVSAAVAKVCGETLGVYLLLEYASDAIQRAFHDGESSHTDAHSSRSSHYRRRPRVCEPQSAFRARSAALAIASSSGGGGGGGVEVEVSARNWFYFEKPPIYDVLEVPSFARNSTLSAAYRHVEAHVDRFTPSALMLRDSSSLSSSSYFDLSQYMAWVAINTLLRNGDYDDEVFFLRVGAQRRQVEEEQGDGHSKQKSKKRGSSAAVAAAADGLDSGYYTVMAWDYDTVFADCHRKGKQAAKSSVIFCGETPIEKRIAAGLKEAATSSKGVTGSTPLAKDFISTLRCVLKSTATVSFWSDVVRRNADYLEVLLQRRGGAVRRATFAAEKRGDDEGYVRRGAQLLQTAFATRHRELLAMVGGGDDDSKATAALAVGGDDATTDDTTAEPTTTVAADAATEAPVSAGGEAPAHHASTAKEGLAQCPPRHAPTAQAQPATGAALKAIRKVLKPEHKWKAAAVAWPSSVVRVWDVFGRPHTTQSTLQSREFGSAQGLYCAELRPERAFEEASGATARRGGDNDGDGCGAAPPSPLPPPAVVVPFVVRGKARGSAEFAVPLFEKPALSVLRQLAMAADNGDGGGGEASEEHKGGTLRLLVHTPLWWWQGSSEGAGGGADAPSSVSSSSFPARVQVKEAPVPSDSTRKTAALFRWPRRHIILRRSGGGATGNDDSSSRSGHETILTNGFGAVRMQRQTASSSHGPPPEDATVGPMLLWPAAGAAADVSSGAGGGGGSLGIEMVLSSSSSASFSSKSVLVRSPQPLPGLKDPSWRLLTPTILRESFTGSSSSSSSSGEKVPCRLRVRGSLEVPAGAAGVDAATVTTIPAGCVLVMEPGAAVVVGRGAALVFAGTALEPITIIGTTDPVTAASASSVKGEQTWRTLLVRDGGALNLSHAFVSGSGVPNLREPGTGKHHKHSAAITAVGRGTRVFVSKSTFVWLQGPAVAAGAAGVSDRGGEFATVSVVGSVVQWAEMGVECVGCDFSSRYSAWSHFPDWTTTYADDDNDALYLSGGRHVVEGSSISHTKDDGIDSGTPEGSSAAGSEDGGSLILRDTSLTMVTHEALALSSSPTARRRVTIDQVSIRFAQQGIESGYTGPEHHATIHATTIRGCAVGIRYGDNYHARPQLGTLRVVSSTSDPGAAGVEGKGAMESEGGGSSDSGAHATRLVGNHIATLHYVRQRAGRNPRAGAFDVVPARVERLSGAAVKAARNGDLLAFDASLSVETSSSPSSPSSSSSSPCYEAFRM